MIIDNIENISKYNKVSPPPHPTPLPSGEGASVSELANVTLAGEGYSLPKLISSKIIDFLQNLTSETPVGHYEIGNGVFANVDQYIPKNREKCKFEAHKKYIDIQMVLYGEENLEYTGIKDLEISEEYDENKDVMFFENTEDFDTVRLTPFKFAFIYPHEAHKPQIKTSSDLVKKVVVKIKTMN